MANLNIIALPLPVIIPQPIPPQQQPNFVRFGTVLVDMNRNVVASTEEDKANQTLVQKQTVAPNGVTTLTTTQKTVVTRTTKLKVSGK